MRCPKCDKENPASRAFCIFCGSPIGGGAPQEKKPQGKSVPPRDYEGGRALEGRVQSLDKEMRQLWETLLRIENRLSALEGLQQLLTTVELAGVQTPPTEEVAPAEVAPSVEPALVEALPTGEPSPVEALPTVEPAPAEALPPLEPSPVEALPTVEPAPAEALPPLEPAPVEALPIKELVGVEALSTVEPARVETTLISEPARVEAMPTVPPPAPPVSKRRPALDWEQAVPGNWLARIGVLALIIGIGFFLKLAFDNDWIGETGRVVLGIVGGVILLGAGEHWQKRYPAWAQALTGGGIAILYLSVFAGFALYNLMTFLPAFGLMFLITAAAVGLALRYESKAIAILGIIGAFATPIILDVAGQPATGGGQGSPSTLVLAYILLLDVGVLGVAAFRNWRWFILLGFACSLVLFGLWYSRSADQASLWVTEAALTGIFLIFAGATSLFHIMWRRLPEPADLGLMVLNAASYFGISYRLLWDDFRFLLGSFSLLLALFYGLLGYVALAKSRQNARLCFFAVGIALVFLTLAIPVQFGGGWTAVAWAAEGAVLMWLSFVLGIFPFRRFSLGVFAIVVIRLVFYDLSVERLPLPIFNERFVAFMAGISAMYLAAHFLWRGRTLIRREERWLFPAFLVAANLLSLLILSAEAISYFGSRNTMILSLTLIWAVYALALIVVGMAKRWRWVRLGGLALLWLPVGKALVYDTTTLEAGYRVAVFTADVFALYLAAYFLWRGRALISKEEWQFFTPFVVAANLMSLWMLSDAAISYIGDKNARSLSLTLIWVVYALVLIVVGMAKRWQWVRLGGLVLLCVPVAKAFVYDTATLEAGYRVAVFTADVFALYLAAYFLWRGRALISKEEWQFFSPFVVAANLMSLWMLSDAAISYIGDENARSLSLTLIWVVYALVLIVVGMAKRWRWVRLGGLALLCVPVAKAFVYDVRALEEGYRMAVFMADISGLYLAAYLLRRSRGLISKEEWQFFTPFVVAANLMSLWMLSDAAISYIEGKNATSLSLTVLWVVYALVLIVLGIIRRWRWVRLGGLVLLCIPVAKAFVFDLFALEGGYRVVAVDISGVYLAAYLLRRSRGLIGKEEWQFFTPFVVTANLMSLWVLSAEAFNQFDSRNAISLSLTLIWAVYALVLIVLGIIRRWRWVRLGGLALLCIPIAKVFVYDLFTLGGGYRVAAFVALGAILIAGGFLYQRYSKVIRRFLLE